jgi:tRNA A37 threonylcarbamoyladenosine synthetase subunit TsaC/SUA5/YrdC
MLGESVSVFLDDGPVATGVASTIIDATGLAGRGERIVRVLRDGAISRAELREVLGDLLEADPREDPPQ